MSDIIGYRTSGFFRIPIFRGQGVGPKPTPSGYLYLMKVKGTNQFKIGTTKEPPKRLETLSSFRPQEMELVFATDRKILENRKHERSVLEKWSHRKIKGEWFALADEEVAQVIGDLLTIQTKGALS